MGWMNSVLIFHNDVTFILQAKIPYVTIPYIDDVPIKGLMTTYQKFDDSYETIPENPGIRQFVWEHFENLNRVVQQMKYCGGMFSGPCKGNLTTLRRILHLDLAKGNPKRML
jgi:hypothetical protein